jgi:hypothetical protein
VSSVPAVNESFQTTPEELHKLIQRAEAGDAKTLPALRKLLEYSGPRKLDHRLSYWWPRKGVDDGRQA